MTRMLPSAASLCALAAMFFAGCAQLEKPLPEPYFAETAPPPKQEFRWSNGKMPRSFDPALAAAPPETDIVRAVYEGLTETDPVSLDAVPAAARSWESSEGGTVWTFELRRDAKWSNGDQLTADDFVRSWKRIAALGETAVHHALLDNIAGVKEIRRASKQAQAARDAARNPIIVRPHTGAEIQLNSRPRTAAQRAPDRRSGGPGATEPAAADEPQRLHQDVVVDSAAGKLGIEAVSRFVVKVTLLRPDPEFPVLAAHPIFRPTHETLPEAEDNELRADIVTNGAFRIASVGQDGVTLDRSETYWNRQNVALERVRFVPAENAEKALEAYRAGEVDAVTNAEFEPLALKLLTPYDDFRRTVHSAVNLYQFNRERKPFDDRRVREALAISIERETLTDDEMDGATKPALSFSPFDGDGKPMFSQDPERARQLLADAGFAGGENFPKVRLLIRRNDTQTRIARSVAEMWKRNLGIESDVVVLDSEEFEAARKTGDYDLVRRGVVLPTRDEIVNMMTIFSHDTDQTEDPAAHDEVPGAVGAAPAARPKPAEQSSGTTAAGENPAGSGEAEDGDAVPGRSGEILSEQRALFEIRAIPLYFPTSYSLVKPYVNGFVINTLDAPSLQRVSIDSSWLPKKPGA